MRARSINPLQKSIILLLFMSIFFAQNAHSKSATPYSIFQNLWKEYTTDTTEMTLLTIVKAETLNEIAPALTKALKIKEQVVFKKSDNVGNVITYLLRMKYSKKSNAKNDFLAIQYSTSSRDFNDYLSRWPSSKYTDEAKARQHCFAECELLQKAKSTRSRDDFDEFTLYCMSEPVCNYEGCSGVSTQNRYIATAISEWYTLASRSDGIDYSIYKDYSAYIKKYGENSIFGKDATDSMEINKDRYDWAVAIAKDSPDAYERYIKLHKGGRHVLKARSLVKELQLWSKAVSSGKYEDYCNYYSEYPDGKYAERAATEIKQHEEAAWNAAKKQNTLKAYENFVKNYPDGYFTSEAENKITKLRIAPYLKEPPSFNSIPRVGLYSRPGYALVCLGNIDRSTYITISLTGPTGYTKRLKPGEKVWIRVKNGSYKILVQASNVQNWWGTAVLENFMYADAWSTSTTWNGVSIGSNRDENAVGKFVNEVKNKAKEEELNTYMYILNK